VAGPDVVELRIHGVGGGSARDQLGDGVVPIGDAADDLAGFWEDREPVGDPPRTLQVYSWGGFSARNATRALWVFLLPFTVVNLAGWMVDPAAGPRATAAQRGLVRVVAYLQTVLLMVWVASLAFAALGGEPLGRRSAMAGGVATVVLLVVAVATIRSRRYEEYGAPGAPDAGGADAVADDDLGLADPEFWQTAPVLKALRRGELGLAAATVAFLPAFSVWRVTDDPLPLGLGVAAGLLGLAAMVVGLVRRSGPVATWLGVTGALLVAASLAVAWSADLPEPGTSLDDLWGTAPLWVLLVAGLVLVTLAVVECLAWCRRGGDVLVSSRGRTAAQLRLWVFLPGLAAALVILWLADGTLTPTGVWAYVVGALAVLVPAGVVVLASRRTAAGVLCAIAAAATVLFAAGANDVWWLGVAAATAAFLVTAVAETGRRDRYRWLPVTTVSALSVLLLAVTGSGLSWVVDRWRGEGSLATGYAWITAVFAGAVIAGALGAVVYLLFRRWEAWPVARVTKEYWGQAEPCRTVMATKAGRRRAVSDVAGSVDVLITVVVWVAASALLVGVIHAGRPAMDLWSPDRLHFAIAENQWPHSWSWLASVGAVLGIALPVAAAAILVAALRFSAIRRIVGVVWDVGTFWPRRFHPLAPPAYAERAIPELAGHITTLVESEGKGVVIVGHSQGAVLSLACALQIEGTDPHRLAALTHGSPVGRYYRRFWPGVFGGYLAAGVAASWEAVGGGARWWNVFRLTDPIGGPLFTGPDERIGRPSTDLCLPDPRPARTGCPGAKGHMGHLSDPDVRAKLDDLGGAVRP
jgi:hypothetical protein